MQRAAKAAAPAAAAETRRYIDVTCTDGQVEKVQRWWCEEPEAVTQDQRTALRTKPKINREPSAISTPFKMLLARLPPDYLNGMVTFFNQRLGDKELNTRPTTKGEI
eukprot:42454-Pleurochrysis_carterae.AAC.1